MLPTPRQNGGRVAATPAQGLLARWISGAYPLHVALTLTGVLALLLPTALQLGLPGLDLNRRGELLLTVLTIWLALAIVGMAAGLALAIAKRRAGDRHGSSAPGTSSAEATMIELSPAAAAGASSDTPSGSGATSDSAAGRASGATRYQIVRELGRGGMGVVYQAMDTVLQREVALKELPLHLGGNTDLAKRFRQEARVLAKLSHPSIVQVHDLIEDEGRLWIALEFVRGGTVADAIAFSGGALPWLEVVKIGGQIAEGLAFAHSRGVIHRDIKPMNVLVTDTHPPMAKLTDFGLARLVESAEHTVPGSLLGSARYMSPEQVAGRPADARSDLYALGVTFFEMLTGRVPFDGEVAAVLARHANEPAPDVRSLAPEVPQELAALVASLLAKAPEDRPKDAGHVVIALKALAAGGGEMREAA
jgi:hypothetical protein